jgi:hypothetical protein
MLADIVIPTQVLEKWVVPGTGVVFALAAMLLAAWVFGRRDTASSPFVPPIVFDASQVPKRASAPAEPLSFGEKRAALRRSGNPVPIYITNTDATMVPYSGWVINRSVGGLCVTVEARLAMPVGTVLSVRATNAPDTIPWVQVEIRNSRNEGKDAILGCQFLKTPSWGVLLLFG